MEYDGGSHCCGRPWSGWACTDVGCGLSGGRLNSVKMGGLGICSLGDEAMEPLRGGGEQKMC